MNITNFTISNKHEKLIDIEWFNLISKYKVRKLVIMFGNDIIFIYMTNVIDL